MTSRAPEWSVSKLITATPILGITVAYLGQYAIVNWLQIDQLTHRLTDPARLSTSDQLTLQPGCFRFQFSSSLQKNRISRAVVEWFPIDVLTMYLLKASGYFSRFQWRLEMHEPFNLPWRSFIKHLASNKINKISIWLTVPIKLNKIDYLYFSASPPISTFLCL